MSISIKQNIALKSTKKQQKQQVKQIKSIIEEYEKKLDNKVNQVINNILNYTIKNTDIILPEIKPINKEDKSFSHKKQRLKGDYLWSKNKNTNQEYIIKQKAESFISVKDSEKSVTEHDISKGRSIGRQTFKKPKVIKRQVQVLSKEMRWNPFCQKNVVKAKDLQMGMLRLIERGKVGKDVDIITAFEKGRPMLNLQPVIFHHGQQKFNKQMPPTTRLPKQLIQFIHKAQKQGQTSNNWAITAPPDQSYQQNRVKNNKEAIVYVPQTMKEYVFIEFLHYQVIENQSFRHCKTQYYSQWSNIKTVFQHICKFLKQYNHQIMYAQINKIISLSMINRKPSKQQISKCMLSKSNQTISLLSIKNIKNSNMKNKKAKEILYSFIKLVSLRKKYKEGQLRHKTILRMTNWIKNSKIKIDIKNKIKLKRNQIKQAHEKIQAKFKQQYPTIANQKHYEIHLANNHSFVNSKFKEIHNTEIIRIFNLQNPNLNIIYLCPFELNNDTMSYYYKIMQLEQIQNYKERVSFISIDPQSVFGQRFSLSKRLYYSSKSLRDIKNKIKQCPSYFMISYPSQIDVNISVYLNIPILSGNFGLISLIHQRTLLQQYFPLKTMKSLKIKPKSVGSIIQLSYQIMKYCESVKNCHRFVIKLNDHYSSSGIALLGYPFTTMPEMYNLTNVINIDKQTTDSYYKKLVKLGGIIQKYQQSMMPIVVVARIHSDRKYQIMGTFDKISFGFVNIGYIFPQKSFPHQQLARQSNLVFQKLVQCGHFGFAEITFFSDLNKNLYLEKVQCYNTRVGSSLFYFRFLSEGYFNSLGQFLTKVVDEDPQQVAEEAVNLLEQRQYCYLPFILHFGLSDRQTNSFFQLCRIGGVSFDLENKYGSTFILLGSLKSCLGIITTAKERQNVLKLMLSSLDFIMKQNSHNLSNEMLRQKEQRMKQRTNILSIKQIIQGYL